MDALRCFCMLFGLLVHGATIGSNALFFAITEVSDHFRMATFFLVSGFFTAMVYQRNGLSAFVMNRGRLILLPFFTGLILLNPVTLWLIQLYHGGGESFVDFFSGGWRLPLPGPLVWHLHLWFLISLFIYALLTPAMMAFSASAPVSRAVRWLTGLPALAGLTLLALLVGIMVTLLRALNDGLITPLLFTPGAFLPMATLNYLTYFAVGVLAFRHRDLFELMHRLFWPGLVLFGAAYLLHDLFAGELPRSVERMTYWIPRAGFIFLIVCGMMAVARSLVTRGSPMLSRLTDGVYSFYIFHFLVIYCIANVVHPLTDNVYLRFLVVVAAGFPILFLIHEKLIARSPLLTLLFNGKAAKKRVKAVPEG
ncbi:MAG: hypothetical protein DI568_11015 [Sphingomonas sp.]|nr:MAG: hypothetical protein DI568_11015 [Sphingomonas sp.]